MKTCKALLAAFLILGFACPATAGWLIKEKSEGAINSLYFQNNQVRDQSAESISIMDLAKGRLILINPNNKTYWSGPFSDMLKMRDQAMNQMQEQLKQLPPEQQAMAKKAMKESMGQKDGPRPKVEVKKTGQSAVIAGFKSIKYEIWADGQLREEQWIAPAIATAKELDTKKMKEMMGVFAQAGGESTYETDPAVQDLWSKGYPVKVINHLDGETMVREVVQAQKKDLPSGLFAAPKGYRRVELMEIFQ
ncbi:MAG: DUF4412 domain-containing protein [Desulfarculaceae bacterium]|nr:DUF4412 domain-containing protein [Desulfarculaceae bacterium]MCF8049420.1 DUF4412 domain-containing protein [Desulfarculaceae bacterium]MCF8098926.1 DUF4412 domain-containing protein [Desulfarculaceae bacterium]MCF8121351.1 DUF4412 domain-containing protein [Desulfarculaceae bacterium]